MSSPILNLSQDNSITGINVIDGFLYWTDDRNEPRGIDIEKFKAGGHSSGTTVISGRQFLERDITVIRPHPTVPLIAQGVVAPPGVTDLPFRDTFPSISYRWRYENNKFSPFAPFSEEVFLPPSDISTIASYETDMYLAGVNVAMINSISSISISGIPIGEFDVEAVEILYTESISSTIYSVETIEITDAMRLAGSVDTVSLSNRNFGSALPPNQLLRPFDNVPRLAKAQESTANRLIYGNYLQNFEQPKSLNISLNLDIVNSLVPFARHTIKTDRTYEVGIALIDEFGRQGAMISVGSVTTPFYAQGPIRITTRVDESSLPSFVETFRYYVKDVSGEHFNLATTDSYNDGDLADSNSVYIWLAFQSRDRNKILGGDRTDESGNTIVEASSTILIPRRHTQGNTTGQIFEGKSEHPVLEVHNEAPQIILDQIRATGNEDLTEDPTQATIELQSEKTDGRFFVKVKRATDAGSGGGDLLASGQSTVSLASGSSNTARIWRVSNTSGSFLGQSDIRQNISVTYAPVGSSTTTTIIITGGEFKTITTSGAAPVVVPSGDGLVLPDSDEYTDDGFVATTALNQIWFETVPLQGSERNVDLFWETANSFSVATELDQVNILTWSNAIGFYDRVPFNGAESGVFIEETRIEGGYNTVELSQGVRVNTPQPNYREDRRSTGLIFSGLFNDRTGINRLNQFIGAEGITKEIEPNYGSIQKLHTRDTNLIVLTENKVFRIQADKDALFNADGSTNISASNNVLGQTIPFIGEYGISKDPESFASYGHNIFFSDRNRGVVLQLTPSNGQIFEISSKGLNNYFRNLLGTSTKVIGAYDDYDNSYDLTIHGPIISNTETTTYNIDTKGWISRRGYISEGGLSQSNRYYTYNGGNIWLHNSPTGPRNNFYGTQYNSSVSIIFNDNASIVKNFNTIGYEGTEGWEVIDLETEVEFSASLPFVIKEGKYHSPIAIQRSIYEIIGLVGSVVLEPNDITDNGYVLRPSANTQLQSGIKGVTLLCEVVNSSTDLTELYSVNTDYFNSSN